MAQELRKAFNAVLILSVALVGLAQAETTTLEQRTATEHAADKPVASPTASTAPAARVDSRAVVYTRQDGVDVEGWLAWPAGQESASLPALIVIHEWWGLNDNIRKTSERLAAEGYVTLAVDLYGGKVATTPKEAMPLMFGLNDAADSGRDNLAAAYDYLARAMGAKRIGVIGWCLGGRWSLQASLRLPDKIAATVIYYGGVIDDKIQLDTLTMPILGLFAEDDPVVPQDTVIAFREALDDLGKDADIHIYAGTKHAFANPSGLAYNAVAAEDAWDKTAQFFAAHLK